ncbi:hypothetical protein [Acinetobacter variabilis]|uniref:ORC-CDC6 family AAA ATPase n=1 Tax=Acinetobacter variabilis TaxID=70346 RepID=UPI0028AB359E|nr:hypothetical protein [Acinetobacter variabilis]
MNPFAIKTPETLSDQDIATLFIDVFSDFPKVLDTNHTFIHGARGTGKSMMLRYLEPKVQIAAKKYETISEIPFFAIYIPIKTAYYNLAELERLQGASYWMLAEHYFITTLCLSILNKLREIPFIDQDESLNEFISEVYQMSKWFGVNFSEKPSNLKDLANIFLFEKNNIKKYLAKISFTTDNVNYNGALFDYSDFFIEFISKIKNLNKTPNGPIYLMLDDADNLSVRMQKILNTWVSYRTTQNLCLKVSTQKKYKTWRNIQDILIESSHDFTEIDINSIYTSKNNSTYYQRIEKIVEKRLEVAGINVNPHDFFPTDKHQDNEILKIKEIIKNNWDQDINKVSSRKSDDVNRYAVSEYMKILMNDKKGNRYSYAGFESLINISSGMIRCFLEPASRMYAQMESTGNGIIKNIPPEIQNEIIKKWSEEFVLSDFDKMRRDESTLNNDNKVINSDNRVDRLKNLINGLGECFQKKLISNDSERRLISFMLTKNPSPELQEILDLAIEWGYLNLGSIAKKEGIGRNQLYTLNRRLAPYFRLDPSGYAAHMSITPDLLELATTSPTQFVSERLKHNEKTLNSNIQQSLEF